MIIIPGKVSSNRVLNCLNPGIKFILRRMPKFVGENEKFRATSRVVVGTSFGRP